MKILILEYDPILTDVLDDVLHESFVLRHAYGQDDAIEMMKNDSFDLYLFDIDMPNHEGMEILSKLSAIDNETPAIVITACSDIKELKKHFNVHLHKYIKKPFELDTLMQAIHSYQETPEKQPDNQKSADNDPLTENEEAGNSAGHSSETDRENREKTAQLQDRDKEILEYLSKHRGELIPYAVLLKKFWKESESPSEVKLRAHIRKIRDAIGREKIITIRGKGYRYE